MLTAVRIHRVRDQAVHWRGLAAIEPVRQHCVNDRSLEQTMQWPGGIDGPGPVRRASAALHLSRSLRDCARRRRLRRRGDCSTGDPRRRANRGVCDFVDRGHRRVGSSCRRDRCGTTASVRALAFGPAAQDNVARKQAFIRTPFPIGLQRVWRRRNRLLWESRHRWRRRDRRGLGFAERLRLHRTQAFLVVTHAVGARHRSRGWCAGRPDRRVRSAHEQHDREHSYGDPRHDPGLHTPGQNPSRHRAIVGDRGWTGRGLAGVSAIAHHSCCAKAKRAFPSAR